VGAVDLIAMTDRVVVRPWRMSEADRFFDMHRRPEVARWIGGRPMTDRHGAVALLERNLDRLVTDPRFGAWAVIERSSGTPAGSVLLKPLPDGAGEIEIGWHLHPDSWGRGLATEAGRALLAYGLGLGLKEVWAVTHFDNQRSVNVCRKLGMRLLGVTHRWYHERSLMFWIGTHRDQQPSLSPDEPAPDRPSELEQVVVQPEEPDSDRAQQILRSYFDDVISRYHGRPITEAELAAGLQEFPSDDLAHPNGVLLVASVAGDDVGCVGLRLLAEHTGEITRLYVAKPHRGLGLAKRLLSELERVAIGRGLTRLRLDTRHDLVEARGLYIQRGYHEVSPFNDGPYADHWFEKKLA
jgi:RimJ/RimL family protein N-acetyltransferase